MVQRIQTDAERRSRTFEIAYTVSFPFLLGIGVLLLLSTFSSVGNFWLLLFTVLFWSLLLTPIVKRISGGRRRLRFLKSITEKLRAPEHFDPEEVFEAYNRVEGKYLGIDKNNGTILYVHLIRKGQIDVVAMTMDDWTSREVEGVKVRLFTKLLELPRIEVGSPHPQLWFDTLGAMEHKQFSTAASFKQHVRGRLDELEREHSVQIPRLA